MVQEKTPSRHVRPEWQLWCRVLAERGRVLGAAKRRMPHTQQTPEAQCPHIRKGEKKPKKKKEEKSLERLCWCRVLAEGGRVLGAAKRQADAMRNAADHLAFLHAELQGSAAPSYDVPTAFEVQQTGGAPILPPFVMCPQSPRSSREGAPVTHHAFWRLVIFENTWHWAFSAC